MIGLVITALVVAISGLVVLIRKARARGKKKFAEGPYKRAGELKQDTSGEHLHDAD